MAEQANMPKKVLIVDKDRSVAQGLQAQLDKYGVKVQAAADIDTALYLFNQQRFDVCVIELEFEPISGLALVQKFRTNTQGGRQHTGMILATGKAKKSTDEHLMKELGHLAFVEKPLKVPKCLSHLSRAFEAKRLGEAEGEAKELTYQTFKATGDVNAAISKANETLKDFPEAKLALSLELLEEAGEHERALGIIGPMLEKNPKDIRLLNAKGRLLLKAGKMEEAKGLFEQADQAAPQNIERLEKMIDVYLATNEPDKCQAKMKELIALNPELKDLKFNFIRDLDEAGFQQHAISLCKETSNPKEVVRYYNNKGVTQSRDGDTQGAIKDYYRALMFYPKYKDNYRILFNMALAEISKKSRDSFMAAEEALEKCLMLAPDFEKAQKMLDTVQEKLRGKPNKAG